MEDWTEQKAMDWGLHEECGVFGICDPAGNCAQTTYYGLYALQHRGQEACGIATINDREQSFYKDVGLVSDVFDKKTLTRLNGTMAVGHVRYATTGAGERENAQPLTIKYVKGTLAVVHNGNLVDVDKLRQSFEYKGAIFHTTSDSELIAYAIAQARLHCGSVEEAVCRATAELRGAFSLLVMSPQKMIACRDPWGFRPLCMGRKGEAILFASESCAIEAVGGKVERELDPGEVVVVQDGKVTSIRDNCRGLSHMCIFEYIYFARPDSVICGQSVHQARVNAGRLLAREHPVEADLVVGVPDSGLDAARGYALESGIPNGMGFVKNRYVGRTFITPDQQSREQAVRIKLSALASEVAGKRIVMVDDSIVRGTTCRQIINLLREAGATEVHMRVSSPPFISPCYFGTDIPNKEKLIACHNTIEEIRQIAGADSLGYLSMEGLHQLAPDAKCGFCEGCFTGKYPIEVKEE
ncbi:amidophosphoribosyltransferase [Pseudoflavonifractor phocaeensis]|uniref:amidophosphoribosyltransferase n=1 Tax=Pseudoflavonifractor phocaeensis TaxID=1870988 RepID=UPI001F19EC32|nr:amidophosphoribosyltransferase [Pseudoflavonifractor phocaeensis]